jgi:hypothetical protein
VKNVCPCLILVWSDQQQYLWAAHNAVYEKVNDLAVEPDEKGASANANQDNEKESNKN